MFGERAMLTMLRRSNSVRSLTYTELMILDRKSFRKLFGNYPDFALAMVQLSYLNNGGMLNINEKGWGLIRSLFKVKTIMNRLGNAITFRQLVQQQISTRRSQCPSRLGKSPEKSTAKS